MTQLSVLTSLVVKMIKSLQFTHRFHRDQTCFGLFDISDVSDIIFKLHIQIYSYFDLIIPKLAFLMTHKEYNTLIDQIWAKYELLDSEECGKVDILALNAECSKLSHLMAHVSELCGHLNLPMPKELHRTLHFKH